MREAEAICSSGVDGSYDEVERQAIVIEKVIAENAASISRAQSKKRKISSGGRRCDQPELMKYGTLKIMKDVVVPRSKVPELVARIEQIGKKHNTFAQFRPAGDGNIHVNFVVDRDDSDAIARAASAFPKHFICS